MSKSSVESAWLFHEVGRCCLEQKKFTEARDYAEKSLAAAQEAADKSWTLHSTVLIAQSEGKAEQHLILIFYVDVSVPIMNQNLHTVINVFHSKNNISAYFSTGLDNTFSPRFVQFRNNFYFFIMSQNLQNYTYLHQFRAGFQNPLYLLIYIFMLIPIYNKTFPKYIHIYVKICMKRKVCMVICYSASSPVKLGDLQSAADSFEKALVLARGQKDTAAEDAINRALSDVNDKIVQGVKDGDDKDEDDVQKRATSRHSSGE